MGLCKKGYLIKRDRRLKVRSWIKGGELRWRAAVASRDDGWKWQVEMASGNGEWKWRVL
jgi:hypothetical protein